MSKKVKINTKSDLSRFLKLLAEESVRKAEEDLGSSEEAFQDTLASDLRKLRHNPSKKKPVKEEEAEEEAKQEEPAKEVPPKEKEPEAEAEDSGEGEKITYTMIKDRLNTIRSGRSLRNKEIREELKDYFKNLDPSEQIALHAFLDGIAQVLTAGVDGSEAEDPSDPPHNVKMTSSPSKEKPDEKPKKKPLGQKPGAEDTAPPIDVGKKQQTEAIRRKIRELMN